MFSIVFTYKDTGCSEDPPELSHATKLVNATHVTYICESGYHFSDSTTVKTYNCECVSLAGIEPCTGKLGLKAYSDKDKYNIPNVSYRRIVALILLVRAKRLLILKPIFHCDAKTFALGP